MASLRNTLLLGASAAAGLASAARIPAHKSAPASASASVQYPNSGPSPLGPTGADTVEGCTWWTGTDGDATCDQLLDYWFLPKSTFAQWNPSVADDAACTGLLRPDHWYCVEVGGLPPVLPHMPDFGPHPQGPFPADTAAADCTFWTGTNGAATCDEILDFFWLPKARFVELNPSVADDADCTGLLRPDHWYCVQTAADIPPPGPLYPDFGPEPLGPTEPDTRPGCTWWTGTDGDATCDQILDMWGLTKAQFVAWNPSVANDAECTGLRRPDYWYCVENWN